MWKGLTRDNPCSFEFDLFLSSWMQTFTQETPKVPTVTYWTQSCPCASDGLGPRKLLDVNRNCTTHSRAGTSGCREPAVNALMALRLGSDTTEGVPGWDFPEPQYIQYSSRQASILCTPKCAHIYSLYSIRKYAKWTHVLPNVTRLNNITNKKWYSWRHLY